MLGLNFNVNNVDGFFPSIFNFRIYKKLVENLTPRQCELIFFAVDKEIKDISYARYKRLIEPIEHEKIFEVRYKNPKEDICKWKLNWYFQYVFLSLNTTVYTDIKAKAQSLRKK